jgi:superfamily II DNA helicase RecQ
MKTTIKTATKLTTCCHRLPPVGITPNDGIALSLDVYDVKDITNDIVATADAQKKHDVANCNTQTPVTDPIDRNKDRNENHNENHNKNRNKADNLLSSPSATTGSAEKQLTPPPPPVGITPNDGIALSLDVYDVKDITNDIVATADAQKKHDVANCNTQTPVTSCVDKRYPPPNITGKIANAKIESTPAIEANLSTTNGLDKCFRKILDKVWSDVEMPNNMKDILVAGLPRSLLENEHIALFMDGKANIDFQAYREKIGHQAIKGLSTGNPKDAYHYAKLHACVVFPGDLHMMFHFVAAVYSHDFDATLEPLKFLFRRLRIGGNTKDVVDNFRESYWHLILSGTCSWCAKFLDNLNVRIDELDGFEKDVLLTKELARSRLDATTDLWEASNKVMLERFITSSGGNGKYVQLCMQLQEQIVKSSDWAKQLYTKKRWIKFVQTFRPRDAFIEHLNLLAKQMESQTPEEFVLYGNCIWRLNQLRQTFDVLSYKKTSKYGVQNRSIKRSRQLDLRKGIACFYDRNYVRQRSGDDSVNCWPFVRTHYGFGENGEEGEVEDMDDPEGILSSQNKLLLGLGRIKAPTVKSDMKLPSKVHQDSAKSKSRVVSKELWEKLLKRRTFKIQEKQRLHRQIKEVYKDYVHNLESDIGHTAPSVVGGRKKAAYDSHLNRTLVKKIVSSTITPSERIIFFDATKEFLSIPEDFYPGQKTAILQVLRGQNILYIARCGSGKSSAIFVKAVFSGSRICWATPSAQLCQNLALQANEVGHQSYVINWDAVPKFAVVERTTGIYFFCPESVVAQFMAIDKEDAESNLNANQIMAKLIQLYSENFKTIVIDECFLLHFDKTWFRAIAYEVLINLTKGLVAKGVQVILMGGTITKDVKTHILSMFSLSEVYGDLAQLRHLNVTFCRGSIYTDIISQKRKNIPRGFNKAILVMADTKRKVKNMYEKTGEDKILVYMATSYTPYQNVLDFQQDRDRKGLRFLFASPVVNMGMTICNCVKSYLQTPLSMISLVQGSTRIGRGKERGHVSIYTCLTSSLAWLKRTLMPSDTSDVLVDHRKISAKGIIDVTCYGYILGSTCKMVEVDAYFGATNATRCGNCPVCKGEVMKSINNNQDFQNIIEAEFQKATDNSKDYVEWNVLRDAFFSIVSANGVKNLKKRNGSLLIFQLLKHKRLVVRYNVVLKDIILKPERNNYNNNNQVWSETYYLDLIKKVTTGETITAEVATTTTTNTTGTIRNNTNINTFDDNSDDDDMQIEREHIELCTASPTITRSNSSNLSNLYSPGYSDGGK